MNIVVLEKIAITNNQVKRLEKLGNVKWFDNSNEEECKERITHADIVIIDWIDPSSFIQSMKSPSLLALMSTGYSWIKHRSEAREKDIIISNVPGYATNAVAEHIYGLLLSLIRKISVGDNNIKNGKKEKGYLKGSELKGKTIGIIGLGNIGTRVAEIAQCFDMKVTTYNRNPKNREGILDVSLDELLKTSDVICVTCQINDESKGLLNKNNLTLLKSNAVLVGTTWDIVVIEDIIPILQKRGIAGFAFDVAVEGGEINLPDELLQLDNVVLTPHAGFNTEEAIIRQTDICILNIEAFVRNEPVNIIN